MDNNSTNKNHDEINEQKDSINLSKNDTQSRFQYCESTSG